MKHPHRIPSIPPLTALMAVQSLDLGEAVAAPEWVHLLPTAKGPVQTQDARGPYAVEDAAAIVQASFAQEDRLPIDENHASDLAAPLGLPAPARGWITGMEVRADGIWGRVEWNSAGARLVRDRAYRGISPVVLHDPDKRITRILRASLVNRPNLRGLAALHMESEMDFMAKLAELLGLPATATEDDLVAAIKKMKAPADEAPALQSAMTEIATALGMTEAHTTAAIVAAAKAARGAPGEVAALQQELAAVTTRLNTMTEGSKRDKATAFVDGAIKAGRVGVKPSRERFITMHMADPDGTEALVNGFPALGEMPRGVPPVTVDNLQISLNAEQVSAARLLGIPVGDYAATLKAEQEAR
ncbi:phage protease [Frigidibacter oleivorans]|uniref:phage protease n=1 Tax=Frigidibacter oleivorans TaxID=2487129 RepID=UPI00197AD982|nr:phage protease [Frigidibacter oleivorans]